MKPALGRLITVLNELRPFGFGGIEHVIELFLHLFGCPDFHRFPSRTFCMET
jgi:hypothetical protein